MDQAQQFLAFCCLVLACYAHATTSQVGGDRDSHGCLASAGYVWCEVRHQCLRPWETACN